MPIYRVGNSFSDSPLGPDGARLSTAIRALSGNQRRRRPGSRLAPIAPPSVIEGDQRTATRRGETASTGSGGGVASPLTEQAYTGSLYYQVVSSDGFFVREFPAQTVYLDANDAEVVVIHLAT